MPRASGLVGGAPVGWAAPRLASGVAASSPATEPPAARGFQGPAKSWRKWATPAVRAGIAIFVFKLRRDCDFVVTEECQDWDLAVQSGGDRDLTASWGLTRGGPGCRRATYRSPSHYLACPSATPDQPLTDVFHHALSSMHRPSSTGPAAGWHALGRLWYRSKGSSPTSVRRARWSRTSTARSVRTPREPCAGFSARSPPVYAQAVCPSRAGFA